MAIMANSLFAYQINEFNRGIDDNGNYILKTTYSNKVKLIEISQILPCDEKEIINLVKGKIDKTKKRTEKRSRQIFNSKSAMAAQIVNSNGVTLNTKTGVFIVQGFGKQINAVKLYPISCSCSKIPNCIHILAAKIAIGEKIDCPTGKVTATLSLLQRKVRGKQKSGKKGALKTSELYVTPAPDSIMELTNLSQLSNLTHEECEVDDPIAYRTPVNKKSVINNRIINSNTSSFIKINKTNEMNALNNTIKMNDTTKVKTSFKSVPRKRKLNLSSPAKIRKMEIVSQEQLRAIKIPI